MIIIIKEESDKSGNRNKKKRNIWKESLEEAMAMKISNWTIPKHHLDNDSFLHILWKKMKEK